MLTYLLVWVIGLGSLGLYLVAYLFPEIHRKNDFVWGGVGLLYALILWGYAKTMPGGLLVGQIASVSLIMWLGQQTLRQRQLLAPDDAPRPEPGSIRDRIRGLVLQGWKLAEPIITRVSEQIEQVLEKPQEAKISEIAVDAPDAEVVKPSFLNQLTDPLSNLSGNLTGLFKSGEKNVESVNTVTVKATPASDESKTVVQPPSPQAEKISEEAPAAALPTESPAPAAPSKMEPPAPKQSVSDPLASDPSVDMSAPVGEVQDIAPTTEEDRQIELPSVGNFKQPVETVEASSLSSPVQDKNAEIESKDHPELNKILDDLNVPTKDQQPSEEKEMSPTIASAESTSQVVDSDAASTEAESEPLAADSSPEQPPKTEVINGGELQPQEKPEKWTAPDPLA